MAILVQREFRVAPADRAEFERQSREGLWPAFLHFGALMVAYGTWSFGGDSDVVLTHTAYADFDHWEATRAGRGAFYHDPAMLDETAALRLVYAERNRLVASSRARVIDLDDTLSGPRPFYRTPGGPLAEAPPTFGPGSVIAEWTHAVADGALDQFVTLSRDHLWPWLAAEGARVVAFGRDPLAAAGEVVTLVAYRSLAEWHRLVPRPMRDVPAGVRTAREQRALVARLVRGRVLGVGTVFGTTS
ncbi:MAG: hypothetical protein O3B31_09585 [Chloroflexi bacterium]|nr:hypothetical protein [Chloroflexota bacterium]MDA1003579.1 hypothetical protein [Chloroflexota bacterium]